MRFGWGGCSVGVGGGDDWKEKVESGLKGMVRRGVGYRWRKREWKGERQWTKRSNGC